MNARVITAEAIKNHKIIGQARLGYRVLVDGLEFESYTPYMGGDYQTLTVRTIQDQQGSIHGLYVSGYPTAKSLLGRMRWLARAAVAGHTGARTHKEAEEARIKGTNIPLIPFMFGATSASKIDMGALGTAWKGVIKLIIKPSSQLVGSEEEIIDRWIERNGRANRYSALLQRGRDRTGGSKVPVKPGILRFKASLLLDYERAKNALRGKEEIIDSIGNFAVALLIATPLILGLGRGSTRGFGRFRPVPADAIYQFADIASILEEIYNSNSNDLTKRALWRLIKRIASPLDILLDRAQTSTRFKPLIPIIDQEGSYTFLDVIAPRNNNSASWLIEHIGRATIKSTWKNKCRHGRINGGVPYHTWLLGLPRSQRFPGGCRGDPDGLRTGYVLARIQDNMACISTNNVPSECNCISVNEASISDARRMSPFILFPVPASGMGYKIVVLGFKSYDIWELVNGFDGKKLFYLSVFNVRDRNKECAVVTTSVQYSLTTTKKYGLDRECSMRTRSLNGRLQLGIANPETCNVISCNDENSCIDVVFNNVGAWLSKVLR